ncbi:hypothetical protein [Oligoflexus tunisiensis]|uniref:hypothetical protein n=1 Tax=Oligoflexus tunisiensis TaxID=708132 RepID=UPI00114C8A97|nr:hypothetical protein [Oligoflexus tunisiensis]
MDSSTLITLKAEVENILRRDRLFGSLHRIETGEQDELILSWDNAVLRPKTRAHPGPYLSFMEEVADCLADYGYCLEADEEASERERNNYLLIVPEDDTLESDEY